jgi:hypothetical protein
MTNSESNGPVTAVSNHDDELRQWVEEADALAAGAMEGLSIADRYAMERAALDAYSVIWAAGKGQQRDHARGILAAIGAAAPYIVRAAKSRGGAS